MSTINQYTQPQWNALKNLKTSLSFMKHNNVDGRYDDALSRQRSVWKYFLNGEEYRRELPEEEDNAAAAA